MKTQITILEHYTKIVRVKKIDELLETIAKESTPFVRARHCSIYMRPQFLNGKNRWFDNKLGPDSSIDKSSDTLVVLARTTLQEYQPLVGEAFYTHENGVTGWILKYGETIKINNLDDDEELRRIHPKLHVNWRYGCEHLYYKDSLRKPFLGIPIETKDGVMGVLTFPGTIDHEPFTDDALRIGVWISQILGDTLENISTIEKQKSSLSRLLRNVTSGSFENVFNGIREELKSLIGCNYVWFYGLDRFGLHLTCEEAFSVEGGIHQAEYVRGEGLIGEVWESGCPKLIPEKTGINLDKWESYSHIAIPVKNQDDAVFGVLYLCKRIYDNELEQIVFAEADLKLANEFGSLLSLAARYEQERALGELLVQIGRTSDKDLLFQIVVDGIQKLIRGTGCSIYVIDNPVRPTKVILEATSRPSFASALRKGTVLIYGLGEGKTGFVAEHGVPLIINHYGHDAGSQLILKRELSHRKEKGKQYVKILKSLTGQDVALLVIDSPVNSDRAKVFDKFASSIEIDNKEFLSTTSKVENFEHSRSYLGIPMLRESKGDDGIEGILGVIVVGRPGQHSHFTGRELDFLFAAASRLSSVLSSLESQEWRKQVLIHLAHEINTPLTGIIADSENLALELENSSIEDLKELAKHNLEEVERLHLLTETMIATLGKAPTFRPSYTPHSIYRPLKSSCSMFESEAKAKGCDIIGPKSVDDPFPVIDMSLSHLTLAFKNLVSNAVKYSYYPPQKLEANRFIMVTGKWHSEDVYLVKIRNYGVGITEEEIKSGSIFLPYVRGRLASDRGRKGGGLGLAYARYVVEDLHGGRIEVKSEKQQGNAFLTTFIVYIPIEPFYGKLRTLSL